MSPSIDDASGALPGAAVAKDCTDRTVLTADESAEEERTVDTTLMEFQEMVDLRDQDPFMYHSIVQKQRRICRDILGEDGELNTTVQFDELQDFSSLASTNTNVQDSLRRVSMQDLEEGDEDNMELQPVLSVADNSAGHSALGQRSSQPRRLSQSLFQAPSEPLPHRQQRRLSQSFSCFTTGVVTRQRRVTTECHPSLIIADQSLLPSLRDSNLTASFMDEMLDLGDMGDLGESNLDIIFGP